MAVKKDEREVKSKKNKSKTVKKITYKCEGSYIDINGVSHRYHKRGFSSSEEAQDWERVFLIKAKQEADSSTTFKELYNLYITSKKNTVKERSLYDIQKVIEKHILPYWKSIKLSNIKMQTIDGFQQQLLNSKKSDGCLYSNETLEKVQVRLKSIFKYGFENGYINEYRITSFKNVSRVAEIKKDMSFWQPKEFDKFMSIVNETVYIALFNVLYWCGLRIGEALALTWNDIDLNDKSIRICKSYTKHKRQTTTPKTQNSIRTVIMPIKCFDAVEKLYNEHKDIVGFDLDKLLFNFNKPLDDNTIRIKKERWVSQANIKNIRIHDFRHSHVSLLINLGFNPFDIAKRLGHSVDMVNNVYGHWFNEAQQKMVDKLNNI